MQEMYRVVCMLIDKIIDNSYNKWSKKEQFAIQLHASGRECHFSLPINAIIVVKNLFFAFCLFGIAATPLSLHAQESVYEIKTVTYDIDGITQQFAIENALPSMQVGAQFHTQLELDNFIQEQNRILSNLRQLESAIITYVTHTEDTSIAVDLLVTVVDSGNFIVLPVPKYNSTDGWELGVRIKHYNFFGTLETFSLGADLLLTNDNSNKIKINPSIFLPFRALDTTWYIRSKLDVSFSLTSVQDTDFVFNNTVGVDLNFFSKTWNIFYLQGVTYSTDPNEDEYYLRSRLGIETDFKTASLNDYIGALTYEPLLYTQVKYRFDNLLLDSNKGLVFGLNNSLYFSQVNWVENLRDGIYVSLINKNKFNTYTVTIDSSIQLESKIYNAFDLFGISNRVGIIYHFPLSASDNNINEFGQLIRGTRDNAVEGNIALYLNVDFTIAGFKNKDALEAQASIFIDGLFATNTQEPINITDDFRLGVGLEGLGFLLPSRSIYMRLSVGFDPLASIRNQELFEEGNYEIFFGFGHHY